MERREPRFFVPPTTNRRKRASPRLLPAHTGKINSRPFDFPQSPKQQPGAEGNTLAGWRHPPLHLKPTTNTATTPTQIATYSGTNFCRVFNISGCVIGFPANFPRGLDGKKNVLYVSRVATV